MTIRNKLLVLRQDFFQHVSNWFQNIAKIFGFPENPGMPIVLDEGTYSWNERLLSDSLPVRAVRFPPQLLPRNYFEVIVGGAPKADSLSRVFYENQNDGYYSFYILNYKNIFFLPNQLSEFLQVRCNFCLDITFLEVSREIIFGIFVGYYYIVTFRILLNWFIIINPYTIPFCYSVALVDWFDELAVGLTPSFAGVNIGTALFSMFIGKVADSVNHLVFTMPFLPSEGVPGKAFVDGSLKDVLIFRYLPILWYKYPIPNIMREYWYTERPDILMYYQKVYENVNIDFLPDYLLSNLTL